MIKYHLKPTELADAIVSMCDTQLDYDEVNKELEMEIQDSITALFELVGYKGAFKLLNARSVNYLN